MIKLKALAAMTFVLCLASGVSFTNAANAEVKVDAVDDKCAVYTSPRAKSLCEQNQRSISRMKDAKEKRRARFQDTRPKTNLQRLRDEQAEQAAAEEATAAEAEGATEDGEVIIDGADENTESITIDLGQDEGTSPEGASDEAKAIEDTLKDAVKSTQ